MINTFKKKIIINFARCIFFIYVLSHRHAAYMYLSHSVFPHTELDTDTSMCIVWSYMAHRCDILLHSDMAYMQNRDTLEKKNNIF